MKTNFVLESFEKNEEDLGFSVQAIMNAGQSIMNPSNGDTYKFKFLFPYEDVQHVNEMVKEFKDIFITNHKIYQFDDKTGVLIFTTIGTDIKEKTLKKKVKEVIESEDCYTILNISNPDEFIAKLCGMKIKYFEKNEFLDMENLFKNELTEMWDEE